MVGGGFQPPCGSISNSLKKKPKNSFYPKSHHVSMQPKVYIYFCSLFNMLPLRSYIKIYFLSAGDKLKPEKLPCNFFHFDSAILKGHLQVCSCSRELFSGGGRELTLCLLTREGRGQHLLSGTIQAGQVPPPCTALTWHQQSEFEEHISREN